MQCRGSFTGKWNWRVYQLRDAVETFLQATQWNAWPTEAAEVSLSLIANLENFEIRNTRGSSDSANN